MSDSLVIVQTPQNENVSLDFSHSAKGKELHKRIMKIHTQDKNKHTQECNEHKHRLFF